MFGNRFTSTVTLTAAVAAVLVLTACAPFADDELRALVEEAAPAGSSLDCEWGKSTLPQDPDAWYGCWYYSAGSLTTVSEVVESQLTASGFVLTRRRTPHMLQLTATRGLETVCIDVLEPGFSRGRNTGSWEVDPAADEVFVDVWSSKPQSFAELCMELPAWSEEF
jgi:hypothetical protein